MLAALVILAASAAPALAAVRFSAPVDHAVGSEVSQLAAAPSVSGEERATVALVTSTTPAEVVLLHTGAGGAVVAEERITLAGDAPASGVALVDVDADGDLDALVPRAAAGVVTVVRRGGAGLTQADVPAGDAPTALAAGDLDGDGWTDLVVADAGALLQFDAGLLRLMGDGAGGFGPPLPIASAADLGGTFTVSPALADVDGDGELDIVVGLLVSAPGLPRYLAVLRGDGTGAFALPAGAPRPAFESTYTGVVSEVTGDGAVDVLLRGRQVSLGHGFPSASGADGHVWPGDGAGGFGASIAVGTGEWSIIGAAQIDGAGPRDLLLLDARSETRRVAVSLAAGAGSFAAAVLVPAPSATSRLAAADLDGDGAVDLVTDRGTAAGTIAFLFNGPVVGGSLEFGEVAVGSASTLSLQVRNEGAAPLVATSARVAGAAAADYGLVDDGCSGRTVPPGGVCTIQVRFRPSEGGARSAEVLVGGLGPAATTHRLVLSGTGLVTPGPAATGPRCLDRPSAPAQTPSGANRLSLTAIQLRINQRIGQAAIRRLNAVQGWLDAGIQGRDLCGGAIGVDELSPSVRTALAPAPLAEPSPPAPRPLSVKPAHRGSDTIRLSASQLLVNQRIFQAAVRRANALEARLEGRLTGGDLVAGAIGQDKLAPRLRILSAPAGPASAPSRTGIAPRTPGGDRVRLTVAQLRINQRVAQAAVRRANALVARIEAGLTGAQFADGSITAGNLAAAVVR